MRVEGWDNWGAQVVVGDDLYDLGFGCLDIDLIGKKGRKGSKG